MLRLQPFSTRRQHATSSSDRCSLIRSATLLQTCKASDSSRRLTRMKGGSFSLAHARENRLALYLTPRCARHRRLDSALICTGGSPTLLK